MCVVAGISVAATEPNSPINVPNSGGIQLTVKQQPKPFIQLEARNTPLAQILTELSNKTGAFIHSSALSNEPINAICTGANVGQVMDCLVSKQISMITGQPEKNKPAEFWLVGNCDEACQAGLQKSATQTNTVQQPEISSEDKAKVDQFQQEQSDLLLRQAQSKDPGERGLALYNLGLAGLKDDPKVDALIRSGLADKNPSVRAQAVTAIAQRGGENAFYDLNQALNDKDFNVRFNAVSGINDNMELLQRASNDSNKMVRELAQGKLSDLKARH